MVTTDHGGQRRRQKQPWEQAVDLGMEICRMIDEDLDDEAATDNADFFESVREGASDVVQTIERSQRVTPKQMKALANWHEAVMKWIL